MSLKKLLAGVTPHVIPHVAFEVEKANLPFFEFSCQQQKQ